MTKRPFNNRLNDLNPTQWLKFQKSWFIHNPSPRKKEVLRHPAKFPETLAGEFIEFFSKSGQVILDPMVGTGSTLIAALRLNRHSYGIELNQIYADIAQSRIKQERTLGTSGQNNIIAEVINGDAMKIDQLFKQYNIPKIHYVLTSPPYWNMLHARGAATQKERRTKPELDVIYSEDPNDLGNISNYTDFLQSIFHVFQNIKPFLHRNAYITIIIKNIKKKGKVYPLAWDLAQYLNKIYVLKDEKIWLQDNQKLTPYGLGNAWVSNTFHHYCLQFRNEID